MSLGQADKDRRDDAYIAIETEIISISHSFVQILKLGRRVASHKHSGERKKIKELIGEMAELSIEYEEGRKENQTD
jgi:hypothetical protein